ncbi:LysR family transcriptional regulator [Deinococcus enclensis]|uniref:DNA-binding transcriptional LysR family regulator n=1 Tax=Deinococcus enclensis TaxID=1049582 RepID=A0ABT9MF07_9DEIO|nr:LysR family transcriptional regulator [Deinococcus enclensis]MDP9765152.1 DNA-binding transcriptional LysR family regulator [Deinococcus enclensis]
MAESTLIQWRVFVQVARKGSLSAAAVELDRTQSAVSHALSELERELGVSLFTRHGRGVRLTAAGGSLLPEAERLLAQWSALHEVARSVSVVAGVVRVAAFPSLARHLLPDALERLRRQHPALSVDVDDVHFDRASVIEAVRAGRADLGLTQLLPGTGLTTHALGEDPYELVAPAAWPPDTVWTRPYIHLGDRQDMRVPHALARHGVQVQPSLSLSSEVAITALVERGLGFALLPRLTMPPLPAGVARHPLPFPVTRSYGTVTRPGPLSAAVLTVVRVLTGD